MGRLENVQSFYQLLTKVEKKVGGKRVLQNCNGYMNWPKKGVYFFFEPDEYREDGKTPRITRIGTHALKSGAKTTLWKRLGQHRGTVSGSLPRGGNHRGSIFRFHVGSAILMREELSNKYPSWGVGSSAPRVTRVIEYPIEREVSAYIGSMPFLWVPIDDPAGPDSLRGYIERNSIALLSNFGKKDKIDQPSQEWLGLNCWNKNVRKSGLWNSNHVSETVQTDFLDQIEQIVYEM